MLTRITTLRSAVTRTTLQRLTHHSHSTGQLPQSSTTTTTTTLTLNRTFHASTTPCMAATPSITPPPPTGSTAPPMTPEQRAQQVKSFKNFLDILLKDPVFTFNSYENMLKGQSGEAPTTASWWDKTKHTVSKKLQDWSKNVPGAPQPTSGQQRQSTEAKIQLGVLEQFTPEQRAQPKLIDQREALRRIPIKSPFSSEQVQSFFNGFEQYAGLSEWLKWRQAQNLPLPEDLPRMRELMHADRKAHGIPKETRAEREQKKRLEEMKRGPMRPRRQH